MTDGRLVPFDHHPVDGDDEPAMEAARDWLERRGLVASIRSLAATWAVSVHEKGGVRFVGSHYVVIGDILVDRGDGTVLNIPAEDLLAYRTEHGFPGQRHGSPRRH